MRLFAGSFVGLFALLVASVPAPEPHTSAGDGPQADPMAVYALHCGPCHGERGRGDGPAGRFLEPEPRDFQRGKFRLVTTVNGVPSDKDLYETIAAGIPGTAMLPFAHLGPETIYGLMKVIRGFHVEGVRERFKNDAENEEELEEWVKADTTPGPTIPLPPETPDTRESRFRGRLHFRQNCATCHGVDGRGIFNPEQKTDEGQPIKPRDLSWGVLKSFSTPGALFRRIRAGVPGTPMPKTPKQSLADDAAWDLVHYLRALIPEGNQYLHSPMRGRITVKKIEGELPKSFDDARLREVEEHHLVLAPMRSLETGVPGISVKFAHDGEHLILLSRWADPSYDVPSERHPTPPDGLAVRITARLNPPIMPIPGQPLPLDRALWLAGPMPEGKDPVFTPKFANPDLVCVSPIGPERVGEGRWISGVWTTLLAITPSKAGRIESGGTMPISFAVFDGKNRRGPLPTAFSHWQVLVFE